MNMYKVFSRGSEIGSSPKWFGFFAPESTEIRTIGLIGTSLSLDITLVRKIPTRFERGLCLIPFLSSLGGRDLFPSEN